MSKSEVSEKSLSGKRRNTRRPTDEGPQSRWQRGWACEDGRVRHRSRMHESVESSVIAPHKAELKITGRRVGVPIWRPWIARLRLLDCS